RRAPRSAGRRAGAAGRALAVRRGDAIRGVDAELLVVRELDAAASPHDGDEADADAERIGGERRQPRFVVDFPPLERRARSLVHARQHAQAERHGVDRFDVEADQLVLRLADPGARVEFAHDVAVSRARLRVRARRQRDHDRVVPVDDFAADHPHVVDARDVVDALRELATPALALTLFLRLRLRRFLLELARVLLDVLLTLAVAPLELRRRNRAAILGQHTLPALFAGQPWIAFENLD